MDGGIGESLLLENVLQGAIVGGGLSALTGGDFLTGALTGGIGGGVKGFLPDFTKMFSPSGIPGTNIATSAVNQAAPSAIAQAGQAYMGAPSILGQAGNYGFTAGAAPVGLTADVATAIPSYAQNPLNQALAYQNPLNQTNVSTPTPNVPGATNTSQLIGGANLTGTGAAPATQPTNYENLIKQYNLSPERAAPTGAQIGTIDDKGMYVGADRNLYDTKKILSAQNPSFFQKYKWPIIGIGGLGLASLLSQKDKPYTAPQTNYPKFGLASNYQALPNPTPVYPRFAEGGIAALAAGGNMAPSKVNVDFMHGDMYPMSQQDRSFYATPTQQPIGAQEAMASYEPKTNPLTGQVTAHMASGGPTGGQVFYDPEKKQYYTASSSGDSSGGRLFNPAIGFGAMFGIAPPEESRSYIGTSLSGSGVASDYNTPAIVPKVYEATYMDMPKAPTAASTVGTPTYSLNDSASLLAATAPNIARDSGIRTMASGGISDLGAYSDGGRMLRGPGDGMSDSIPGMIAGKRPARLAEGEFVVPADVVSHLGNGSTDAGAKQLYAMMDRVRQARTGSKKQGRQINPRKLMTA